MKCLIKYRDYTRDMPFSDKVCIRQVPETKEWVAHIDPGNPKSEEMFILTGLNPGDLEIVIK